TLNMSSGTSSSGDLSNGFTVSQGFSNAGTLSLAANVTGSIHGDYTQAASGALKIGVASDSSYGKLTVDGAATLVSNAKVVVDVSSPSYSFSSQSLQDVLSAGTLNSDGTFAVSDNSLLFNFGAVKDGNTVDLTLSKGSSVLDSVISAGNTPAVGAAKALDQAIGDDPDGELAGHFVGLTSEQEVSDAVTQTLPTVAGNTSNAIGNTLSGINRVVQARQAGNSGLSSGDAVADDNLWIKTFGAWADQDSRDGISGFDANTQGLAIGADAALDAHTRLGLAFAYAQTNLNGDSAIAPQSADIDTFQLIGYGSYALAADTELNVQLDGGQNRTSSKRHMPFADARASADYDGYNVHAGIGIGHSLRLNEQLTFIPSARADYTWIGSESYHEKGAGALDLDVDSNDAEALLLSVDGKLDYRITEATVISANLGAGYDVIDEDSAITSTYAGAPGAAF
ncbi:autotransporter outer membrane beta-barrel domain-containing protein, partial [Aquipseudomonas alcaligenes]